MALLGLGVGRLGTHVAWHRELVTVFVDQFSGATLARTTAADWGGISEGTDYLVSTHMGTQFGLINRIVMTSGCVLLLWSVFSAVVMYTKRRRKGSIGLPRRPIDVKLTRRLGFIAIGLAIIYPMWGFTAASVLTFDRFIIRRMPGLRKTFGQAT